MDKEKKRKRNLVLNGIAIPIGNMVFQTYLVGAGALSLREAIKLFWTFRVPGGWTYTARTVADLKKAYVKKSY